MWKQIVIYEPDINLKEIIENNIKDIPDTLFVPKGVYSSVTRLRFTGDGSSGGGIVAMGDQSLDKGLDYEIVTTTIDGTPECRDATYIKMDLEGSEWDALHGAEQTILRNKPKLGICIYHTNEDRLRLIEYIHDLVPEYKLYIRQHSKLANETVMYAMVE